jgi:hypothetical protein
VNTAANLWCSEKAGKLLDSQGVRFMEFVRQRAQTNIVVRDDVMEARAKR